MVLLALLLTSCDTFYQLMVENATDQDLRVRVTGGFEFHMRPCSVQIYPTNAGPPFQPVQVDIEDAEGRPIRTDRIKPTQKGGKFPEVYVRVSPEGASECPTAVQGTYVLVLENYSSSDAEVWLNDKHLGSAVRMATTTLGPFSGTWDAALRTTVRDSLGTKFLWGMQADYDLGQVPRFFVSVHTQ